MAKKSMINRDIRRARLIARYAARRVELKKVISSTEAGYDEKMAAQAKLQKMPRDASAARLRTRCALTGRPRAVYVKFGLARSKLREATMRGDVPGLRKASW
jgi:small subunit ribosomal protein S14